MTNSEQKERHVVGRTRDLQFDGSLLSVLSPLYLHGRLSCVPTRRRKPIISAGVLLLLLLAHAYRKQRRERTASLALTQTHESRGRELSADTKQTASLETLLPASFFFFSLQGASSLGCRRRWRKLTLRRLREKTTDTDVGVVVAHPELTRVSLGLPGVDTVAVGGLLLTSLSPPAYVSRLACDEKKKKKQLFLLLRLRLLRQRLGEGGRESGQADGQEEAMTDEECKRGLYTHHPHVSRKS